MPCVMNVPCVRIQRSTFIVTPSDPNQVHQGPRLNGPIGKVNVDLFALDPQKMEK